MWEELESPAPDMRDVAQKREDTDRLIARVFGDEDGQKLLELMRDWYVHPPVATPGTDASWAYYNEGKRFVIQDIEARLRRATNG
jgi:hypothetical protein